MNINEPTPVSIETFFGKYWKRMEEAHSAEFRRGCSNLILLVEILGQEYQPPPMRTSGPEWERVARWWPFGVLREAAEENDPEACKRLIAFFLAELGIRLPKGVLIPFGLKRGRSKDAKAEEVYQAWVAQGRPKPTARVCDELARRFCGPEFARAKSYPAVRTRLRRRVRATIVRYEARSRNSHRIS
jgi:hypothetical protein